MVNGEWDKASSNCSGCMVGGGGNWSSTGTSSSSNRGGGRLTPTTTTTTPPSDQEIQGMRTDGKAVVFSKTERHSPTIHATCDSVGLRVCPCEVCVRFQMSGRCQIGVRWEKPR